MNTATPVIEPFEEGDTKAKVAQELAHKLNEVLLHNDTDAALNALIFVIASFLASKSETDREVLLDHIVKAIRLNTRHFAGEPQA